MDHFLAERTFAEMNAQPTNGSFMPKESISVVIRTKNEEKWLWRCLSGISNQSLPAEEIIIVDNSSTDNTVEIASDFGVSKILSIEDYTPGKALNLGISECSGELIAIISAHCVPESKHWLRDLVRGVIVDDNIAAGYGRQIPMPFSSDDDKADLLAVFRPESRIQNKDGFLNNANSLIRKRIWDEVRFDEEVQNIEDRVWGELIISLGMSIAYISEATVFHHNGLHRASTRKNQKSTVRVLEQRVRGETSSNLEEYKSIFENRLTPIMISNSTDPQEFLDEKNKLSIATSDSVWDEIVAVSEIEIHDKNVFSKESLGVTSETGLDELLKVLALKLRILRPNTQYIGLFISRMGLPSPQEVEALVSGVVLDNSDFAFLAERELRHIWFQDNDGEFVTIEASLAGRESRKTTYISSYGQGSIFPLQNCIRNQLFEGRATIVTRGDAQSAKGKEN